MPESCCSSEFQNGFLELQEHLGSCTLKVCVSKLCEWQVGPSRSLLAHAVSQKVSILFRDRCLCVTVAILLRDTYLDFDLPF